MFIGRGALANKLGLAFLDRINEQIFIGLSGGLISLGITSFIFYLLEKINRLRISPELSNRSMFLSGFTLRQGLNMSLQSSIGEEVIYRLLMISLFLWLSNNTVLSILLSSFYGQSCIKLQGMIQDGSAGRTFSLLDVSLVIFL